MPLPENLRTRSGHPVPEVASALQKCARRGMITESVYWCKELVRSGFGGYAWRRTLAIATEDVGQGDPSIAMLAEALHRTAVEYLGKRTPNADDWVRAELFLLHAVVAICRAQKSRMVADVSYAMDQRYAAGERIDIPAFALDQHTPRGRELGRTWTTRAGVNFWQTQSRVVHPAVVLDEDRWRAECDQHWAAQRLIGDPDE